VHLDATEHGDSIVFLHAVKDGPANRSYGLQVAQLAGVPRGVIAEARRYLEHLEAERDRQRAAPAAADGGAAQTELPLFAEPDRVRGGGEPSSSADALREARTAIDPDELSPRAALEALYALRRLLGA
jgi:DNA mismatch repair protein MutS